MFFLSCNKTSFEIVAACFSTAMLSPVKMLSSTFALTALIILASAGTLSPASSSITSPTTSFVASVST